MSLFNLFRLWPFYFNAFLYRISYNRRKSGEDNEKFNNEEINYCCNNTINSLWNFSNFVY